MDQQIETTFLFEIFLKLKKACLFFKIYGMIEKNSRERTRFYLLFSLNTRILRMKKFMKSWNIEWKNKKG